MTPSRRDVIKAIGAALAAWPIAVSAAVAQGASTLPRDFPPETEAWLAQFDPAWKPLDPQVRFVLRLIYGQLKGLPPPAELAPAQLRNINASLSFYLNAGAPALAHVEERTIRVPSGEKRVRLYDPGTPAPAATV